MKIQIDRESKTPVYLEIATQIKKQILTGNLPDGVVLPSERTLAENLGVHRNTITRAYNELKTEGYISASQGVSYTVSHQVQDGKEFKGKKVNWANMIKQQYQDMSMTFDDLFERYGEEGILSLGGGISSPRVYDAKEISKTLGEIIAEEGKSQYFYSPYQGDETLIKRISSFLSTKGIKANKSQIQILSETNQALDFLVTILIRPGDTVMMEEPVSPDAYRAMELAGARIITIPIDDDGMITATLEAEIQKEKPALIYVNSSYHDPTGAILSLKRRKELVDFSSRYRIPIIEDDAASELNYEMDALPTIKSMDRDENVIYIYSFSLTFAPGLSLAFVVGPKKVIRSLSYLVSVRLVAIDWVTQKLLAKYMSDGTYYRKLEEFRKEYRKKRDLMCARLDDMGLEYVKPKGGVYVWVKLPKGVDSKELMDECYKRRLTLLSGNVFYPKNNGGRDHIRLNYSYEEIDKIEEGLTVLKEVLAHKK
ncbi:MAG: PLP-dependent aminotransferase family protein [Clostridia bacterium]|nr:PLP-dependent aminotransferase family protein [Clostridia bacterium]